MNYQLQRKDSSEIKYILYARKSTESEDRQIASIDSQVEIMTKKANDLKLKFIDSPMTESSSGFHIGRKVFNEMLDRIENGEINGIVCWKLSRLSRNPDDAGRIMGMLQRGIIKHIRTHDRDWYPEDNVLMMYMEFGFNNQYSRDISIDVERGYMQKAKRGWFPASHLPPGYLHNPFRKLGQDEIVNDPERYELIKKGLELVATKVMTPKKSLEYITKMGLRTKKGNEFSESTFYYMLNNTFYYGDFEHPQESGQWHIGKHNPMITEEQFETIQCVLGNKAKARPKTHFFPYTGGLLRCGECGCSITAENKEKFQQNGNVHNYTYYHCTKKKTKCSQKSIEVKKLEDKFTEIIKSIKISDDFHEWAIEELEKDHNKEIESRGSSIELIRKQSDECTEEIDNLVKGYYKGKIPEDSYDRELAKLQKKKKQFEKMQRETDKRMEEWIEIAEEAINFANKAKERFENGGLETKKEIITYLGSNLILNDGKLSIELKKPLEAIKSIAKEAELIQLRFEPLGNTVNKGEFKKFLSNDSIWLGLKNMFRNRQIEISLTIPQLQTVFSSTSNLLSGKI